MMRSLRSRFLLASVLWTCGLLMMMHMLTMLLVHVFPSIRGRHSWLAVGAAVLLMGAGVMVARRGLAPLGELRRRLGEIRAGRERRMGGEYPSEVQPLVEELNELLRERERALQRAFATAGDLAHGLKTPLALLGQMGEREEVGELVERMTRQVNYHLARARAAASGAAGTSFCEAAECGAGLVRTMRKLHAERGLVVESKLEAGLRVRVQAEDLEEMLGNLLDNACKWGRGRVELSGAVEDGWVVFDVDDDGPGLEAELRAAALQRGVRLDEAAPGSGLGLAIVTDLAEIYGGMVGLLDSPLGGLRARVRLPALLAERVDG